MRPSAAQPRLGEAVRRCMYAQRQALSLHERAARMHSSRHSILGDPCVMLEACSTHSGACLALTHSRDQCSGHQTSRTSLGIYADASGVVHASCFTPTFQMLPRCSQGRHCACSTDYIVCGVGSLFWLPALAVHRALRPARCEHSMEPRGLSHMLLALVQGTRPCFPVINRHNAQHCVLHHMPLAAA